jgi:hypothetical protein
MSAGDEETTTMKRMKSWACLSVLTLAACGAPLDESDPAGPSESEAAAPAPLAAPVRARVQEPLTQALALGAPVPALSRSQRLDPALPALEEVPLLDPQRTVSLPGKPGDGPQRYTTKTALPPTLVEGSSEAPGVATDALPGGGPSTAACVHALANHGGRIIAAPRVHRLFWGSWWGQAAHTAEATSYNSTWTTLANSPAFFNRISEYGVGLGSAGSRLDISSGATGTVAETTFQSSLRTAIVNAGITPTSNDIFTIFLPSGTMSANDIAWGAAGHHDHFSATIGASTYDIVYAIIEYSTDRNYTNPVVSHELMEASTDPDLNAWFDNNAGNAENGDLCRGIYNRIGGVWVETIWSQVACRCVAERDLNAVDYDGDGKSAPSIFRPSPAQWWSYGAPTGFNYGQAGDLPVPGDFNGDGRTELNLFRPSTGQWFMLNSATATYTFATWGTNGDIPVPADYDGDGITDLAVWRPSNGTWYIVNSSTGATTTTQWGTAGDAPVPADYDGDGKADPAVRRPSTSTWYVLPSTTPGSYTTSYWGLPTDVAVTGDFNGDGKADWAMWRASEARFYVSYKDVGGAYSTSWGAAGDVPVPRDYDGDWKTDLAVYRPSNQTWYVINSATGSSSATQWGVAGDIPVLRMPQ